jgi:hypothetical protein
LVTATGDDEVVEVVLLEATETDVVVVTTTALEDALEDMLALEEVVTTAAELEVETTGALVELALPAVAE